MSNALGSNNNGVHPLNLQTIQTGNSMHQTNAINLITNSNSPSAMSGSLYYDKIIEKFGREDSIRILVDYLSNPHQNKL